jgi:hypothetical protein
MAEMLGAQREEARRHLAEVVRREVGESEPAAARLVEWS